MALTVANSSWQLQAHSALPSLAQMILLFLTMYVFTAPFLFCAYFGWFTCIPSTILCLAYFGINEIALEIEDPFGEDENDLPMEQMGDALKVDCEMFMEVTAAAPTAAPTVICCPPRFGVPIGKRREALPLTVLFD